MIRALTDNEIHELLEKECYAHLACRMEDGRPYLVPITYVYAEGCIHSFSFEGKKLALMRRDPSVCVQVEHVWERDEWRSAMAWGTYEELRGEDRVAAFSLLLDRLWRESSRDHPLYLPFRNSAQTLEAAEKEQGTVLYRIRLGERTGRMEKYE